MYFWSADLEQSNVGSSDDFGSSDDVAWGLEGILHGIVDADTGFVKQSLSSYDKVCVKHVHWDM